MGFLGIGKKDRDGRQVRIEHRGENLRASRTGGIALREQIRAGGLSLTANSQRGARVSMTPTKNTQVAFQNSRFVLRGRYGKGPAKINLSKSGLSLSSKLGLGTINITNPGRSSAKIGGVQMRGQKAAAINAIVALFQALVMVIRIAVALVVYLVVGALNLAIWLHETASGLLARARFHRQHRRREKRTCVLEEAASQWKASNGKLLESIGSETCLAGMENLLLQAQARTAADGRGVQEQAPEHESSAVDSSRALAQRLSLVDAPASIASGSGSRDLPAAGLAVLATHYRDSVARGALPNTFYRLDEVTRKYGPRTVGQEILLEDIADLFGLRLEPSEEGATD